MGLHCKIFKFMSLQDVGRSLLRHTESLLQVSNLLDRDKYR